VSLESVSLESVSLESVSLESGCVPGVGLCPWSRAVSLELGTGERWGNFPSAGSAGMTGL
jgi:hypothetical protein